MSTGGGRKPPPLLSRPRLGSCRPREPFPPHQSEDHPHEHPSPDRRERRACCLCRPLPVPLNPRLSVNEASIEPLAQNLRDLGLIQNLAGLRDPEGRVGIVAGGRRLRALALVQDDPRFHVVPVRIAPDEATAVVWASSENHQREQPHPADEVREYGALAARGVTLPAIAFGVTERHVQRRLALAGLPEPVIQALREDAISLGQAAAFTISDDEAVTLDVLARVRGYAHSDHAIKRMLKPESIRGSDRRAVFVGRDEYVAAGGRIGGDLFADEDLFDDPAILASAFEAKLRRQAEWVRHTHGWKWASFTLEDYVTHSEIERLASGRLYPVQGNLTDEQQGRYDELAELANGGVVDDEGMAELEVLSAIVEGDYTPEQKVHSGALIYVERSGDRRVVLGLVRAEDREAAEAAGVLAPSARASRGAAEPPTKPVMSAALSDDLKRIARGARQNAVLEHPDLLLDLLAFQIGGGMGTRRALGLHTETVETTPATDTGYVLDERLTTRSEGPKDPWRADYAKAFRTYRKQGPEAVRADLTRALAVLVSVDDEALASLIDKEAKTSIRAVWTPTAENFFGRVSGVYLDAL